MASPAEAAKILDSMKTASETVRSAVINAIPVAPNQVLTVSVPGAMINWKDFYYDADQNIKAPLAVQVKEARLVDGMIPLSKYTAGKTGKSVARSYLSALDLLVPVEASVSGVIGNNPAQITDQRLKVIKDRYEAAMNYLKSPDEGAGANGRSKVDTYVMKQAVWAREVSTYAQAQGQALELYKPPSSVGLSKEQIEKNLKDSREKYMQWIQEHGRDFKNTIQTKYMDWVVHGYKFMVDYNFGIVDIASGMKRIENSKEAFRNLTLIAEDGASEYQTVILTPSDWATIVRDKTINWQQRNNKPTAAEIRAELRRLKNLLISHRTLDEGIESNSFYPVMSKNSDSGNAALQKAYAEVYSTIDDQNADAMRDINKVTLEKKNDWKNRYQTDGENAGAPANAEEHAGSDDQGKTALQKLAEAQAQWNEKSLSRNNTTIRQNQEESKRTARIWLAARISQLEADIELLQEQLGIVNGSGAKMLGLPVVNEQGVVIDDSQVAADPVISGKEKQDDPNGKRADPWTRISCKASRKSDERETETSESSSAVAASGGWGLFSASGGFSYSESSSKAMQKMSNLDVEITMDCMVVEIDRPWLHAELFADAELDSGRFDISPGEESLKGYYDKGQQVPGFYQQFSSFPTAFVVAADVELSFSGDTTELESAMSASSMSANVSVGYGPFALSASHSNSKSKSKTKMESTATGCKISIQAPQIVGWVQNLLPQLPKARDGVSTMVGLFQ